MDQDTNKNKVDKEKKKLRHKHAHAKTNGGSVRRKLHEKKKENKRNEHECII